MIIGSDASAQKNLMANSFEEGGFDTDQKPESSSYITWFYNSFINGGFCRIELLA